MVLYWSLYVNMCRAEADKLRTLHLLIEHLKHDGKRVYADKVSFSSIYKAPHLF